MFPLLIAMGAVLFAVIGYALRSPDPVVSEGIDKAFEDLTEDIGRTV